MRTVEFVSYDGEFPNLCTGTLTVRIDDKIVTFGYYNECDYGCFWYSGGCVSFEGDECFIDQQPWKFDTLKEFPAELADCYEELCQLFHDNVEMGCCGGCL